MFMLSPLLSWTVVLRIEGILQPPGRRGNYEFHQAAYRFLPNPSPAERHLLSCTASRRTTRPGRAAPCALTSSA